MKTLSEYKDPEEVIQEIQKRFPILRYQENNDHLYDVILWKVT